MREPPKADPDKCPICNYRWSLHTTKGARECRADLARSRGEEPIVAVPRPPTVEERTAMDERDLARAADAELVPARGLNGTGPRAAAPPVVCIGHSRIAGSRARGVDPKAARAWAIANGHHVPARGILTRAVVEAYVAAHGNGQVTATLVEDIRPDVTPTPDPPPSRRARAAAPTRYQARARRRAPHDRRPAR